MASRGAIMNKGKTPTSPSPLRPREGNPSDSETRSVLIEFEKEFQQRIPQVYPAMMMSWKADRKDVFYMAFCDMRDILFPQIRDLWKELIGYSLSVDQLTEFLKLGKDNWLRFWAIQGLATLNDVKSIDTLVWALGDSDWKIRLATLQALGEFTDNRFREQAQTRIHDPEPLVRRVALEILSKRGTEASSETRTEGTLFAMHLVTVQEMVVKASRLEIMLERDGVLKRWSLSGQFPQNGGQQCLAKPMEDKPLVYAKFEGPLGIPSTGGVGSFDVFTMEDLKRDPFTRKGVVKIWDQGSYKTKKWTDREIIIFIEGTRLSGRYRLLYGKTKASDWSFVKD
jgi:hypothetical protein